MPLIGTPIDHEGWMYMVVHSFIKAEIQEIYVLHSVLSRAQNKLRGSIRQYSPEDQLFILKELGWTEETFEKLVKYVELE